MSGLVDLTKELNARCRDQGESVNGCPGVAIIMLYLDGVDR